MTQPGPSASRWTPHTSATRLRLRLCDAAAAHRRPEISTSPDTEPTITDTTAAPTAAAAAGPNIDAPYGGLPPAQRTILRAHHIELAVAEVRFGGAQPITAHHGLALRDAAAKAGLALPVVEESQRQDVAFTVGPHGPATSHNIDNGWLLTTADRSVAITIFSDLLIVQHTRYTRFSESLRPALEAILPAVAQQLSPVFVQRIGLRYINRLNDSNAYSTTAWRGRITPAVLGVLEHDVLGGTVTATQQQIELGLDDAGALIRHGAFRDAGTEGPYSYLLDIDVFNTTTDRFDAGRTVSLARKLNRTALALFHQIVLSEYRDTMGPYPAGDEKRAAR